MNINLLFYDARKMDTQNVFRFHITVISLFDENHKKNILELNVNFCPVIWNIFRDETRHDTYKKREAKRSALMYTGIAILVCH